MVFTITGAMLSMAPFDVFETPLEPYWFEGCSEKQWVTVQPSSIVFQLEEELLGDEIAQEFLQKVVSLQQECCTAHPLWYCNA